MRVRVDHGSRITGFGNSIPWTSVDEVQLVAMALRDEMVSREVRGG